jgi:16S rRNA (cytosine1402-N4)-methyltransferase
VTAAGIVNEAAERDLATIFKRYGESATRSRSRARSSAGARSSLRADERSRRDDQGGHPRRRRASATVIPAKRVFQALRIAVNDELGALEAALPAAFAMLRPAAGSP